MVLWEEVLLRWTICLLMGSLSCTYEQILWLGCSDSRVPESVITASRPGDIFVHRNIANQVHPDDDSVLSVLTYAVAVVGVEHSMPPFHTHIYMQYSRLPARSQLSSSCRRPLELRRCCGMPPSRNRGRPSARTDDASLALARASHRTRRDARPPGRSQFRSDDEDCRGERPRPGRERCRYGAREGSMGRQEEPVGARSRL